MTDTDSEADVAPVSTTESGDRPVAEARQCLKTATERPERAVERRARLVELLSASTAHELETRATASGALAIAARTDPARVGASTQVLLDELAAELERTVPEESPQRRALSRATRDQLVSSIGRVLADSPGRVAGVGELTVFTDAVSTDLEEGAMRAAAQGLFTVAGEHPAELAEAIDSLGAMVTYPAWCSLSVPARSDGWQESTPTLSPRRPRDWEHCSTTTRWRYSTTRREHLDS
jgi:hypothetical protein